MRRQRPVRSRAELAYVSNPSGSNEPEANQRTKDKGSSMRIGRSTHAIMSAGVLLTAGFHSIGYAQQSSALSQGNSSGGVKNIVLVHGAWADGSSWFKVIPLLEARG